MKFLIKIHLKEILLVLIKLIKFLKIIKTLPLNNNSKKLKKYRPNQLNHLSLNEINFYFWFKKIFFLIIKWKIFFFFLKCDFNFCYYQENTKNIKIY
jgi:hypothetical protein